MDEQSLDFGDKVRIRVTPQTIEHNLAGRLGEVFGVTVPSISGVKVIGETRDSIAVNVHFGELNQEYWLARDLVEFVDRGSGTVITLDGIKKKWVRNKDGGWDEFDLP